MRDALKASGFYPGIMNNDYIPEDLVNMGLEMGKDHFSFVMRANIFQNPDVGWNYIYILRNIIQYYALLHKSHILVHPPGPYGVWVDNRDTVYVKTESFQLDTDDDCILIHGVNNTQTGFATFINVSLYGNELWNGVAGTVFTNELQYPADEYFSQCDKNSRNFYVVKMARRATEGNEIIIPYSTDNPKGSAYGVDNHQNLFLVIRMYVNQKTKVASAPFDIIWGHAIF